MVDTRPFLLAALLLAAPAAGQAPPPAEDPAADAADTPVAPADDPRYGVLTPLPEAGPVPPMIAGLHEMSEQEKAWRAKVRDYRRQLRMLRREHFGQMRVPEIRRRGIEQLAEFTDPASFRPMIEELAREADDVRLGMLDHLVRQGNAGQGALAWIAIHDRDPGIRHEAARRLVAPPPDQTLVVLDRALRSADHDVANAAGTLAGALNVLDAIPLLIFSQVAGADVGQQGDVAWIAIETQRAYVQALVPVVGDAAGAFQPVMGTFSEGSVLRVIDAVAIVYRTHIHSALVDMTSHDWGQSTAHLGYNIDAWWAWYNDDYVPFKNEQARLAALGEAPPPKPAPAGEPAAPPGPY
ncbi:MAG: HEAT repeat domain-containing protein [Planctomycetota bacterium]|jgi:hypothetical protein